LLYNFIITLLSERAAARAEVFLPGLQGVAHPLQIRAYIIHGQVTDRSPVDRLQTSPWCPPGSVISPHWPLLHWCGAQRSSPRWRPTATLTAWFA